MSNGTSSTPEPFSTDEVNQQILGAVQASTDFAFGLTASLNPPVAGGTRLSAGAAIAYEKAAQAAALSVQDVSDYARNVMSVAGVAQGKALAEILAGVNVSNAQTAMTLAQAAVTAAIAAVAALATAQTAMLSAFPRA
jgi:hypothetical protein